MSDDLVTYQELAARIRAEVHPASRENLIELLIQAEWKLALLTEAHDRLDREWGDPLDALDVRERILATCDRIEEKLRGLDV